MTLEVKSFAGDVVREVPDGPGDVAGLDRYYRRPSELVDEAAAAIAGDAAVEAAELRLLYLALLEHEFTEDQALTIVAFRRSC